MLRISARQGDNSGLRPGKSQAYASEIITELNFEKCSVGGPELKINTLLGQISSELPRRRIVFLEQTRRFPMTYSLYRKVCQRPLPWRVF